MSLGKKYNPDIKFCLFIVSASAELLNYEEMMGFETTYSQILPLLDQLEIL